MLVTFLQIMLVQQRRKNVIKKCFPIDILVIPPLPLMLLTFIKVILVHHPRKNSINTVIDLVLPPLPLINVGKINSNNAGAPLTMRLRITQSPQYVDHINHYFNNILPTLIQGERGGALLQENSFNIDSGGAGGGSIISIKYYQHLFRG